MHLKPFIAGVYGSVVDYINLRHSGVFMTEISCLEKKLAGYIGTAYAVALSSGNAALHLAVRLAAEKTYGKTALENGSLAGKKVFLPNFADSSAAEIVISEGGEPVFVDASAESWGMDPEVLEIAFDNYPEVKIVIASHIYGFPCQIDEIRNICDLNGALLIEDARDALGAGFLGKRAGSFGDYSALSFGKNRILDAGAGGALLTNDEYSAETARLWMIGSCYKSHQGNLEKVSYSYVISPLVVRKISEGLEKLDGKIKGRREVYETYAEKFPDYMIELNPIAEGAEPNFAQIAMTVESDICFEEERYEDGYSYTSAHGTAAPMQIIETLAREGLRAKPVYKPLSAQSEFMSCEDVTLDGKRSEYEFADNASFFVRADESARIWKNGVCLPMEIGKIDEAVDAVLRCFDLDAVSFKN